MNVRGLTAVFMSLLAVAASACGNSDGVTTTSSGQPEPIAYPTDPETAIVRIGAPNWLPAVVIGGDGWVYQPTGYSSGESNRIPQRPLMAGSTAAPAVAPAPPEPTPVERRQLTPDGIQTVLALADDLGLLAVPDDYEDPGVTDMGSTSVTIEVVDGTYEHIAYALGFDDEVGNRRNLEQFVTALADIESLVGPDDIGPPEPYVPETYAVSLVGSFATDGYDVTWPSDVPVEEGCVALRVDRFSAGVAGLYIAVVDGTETRVSVVPDLPGDDC